MPVQAMNLLATALDMETLGQQRTPFNSFVDEKKREFAAKLTEFNSMIKTG